MAFLDALVGFAGGAAQEVVEISKDERKQLADKLRMEAQAEIDRIYQTRGFEHKKEMEGERVKNEGILEEVRQKNRMSVEEKRAALREKGSEKEFLRKKEAGAFDKPPVKVGPGERVVTATGEEIARSEFPPRTSTGETSDEKNYARFLSENPTYQGDFMSWKKMWTAPDQRKSALEMAQNDMRVMKDQSQLQAVANEYLQYLTGNPSGGMTQTGPNTFDITELVKKGRALRGVK